MLFSIVTVAMNSEATIADTLASVKSQDFSDYEHIIVDGNSQDGTVDVVRKGEHSQLRWISEPDAGLYDAMNKGLAMAQGDYVLFLNSDDFFSRSDALTLAAARITDTKADCLFADVQFVRSDGKTPAGRVYSARRFHRLLLRFGVMPPHPSMFVRREVLIESGGFDTSFRIAGDFDMIARILLKRRSSFALMPEVISSFRVGGVSTDGVKAKLRIGTELARSLRTMGQPLALLAVQLRYPLKLLQLRW